MIKRQMTEWLEAMAREYAVISIMGPRQSGKTTLARMLFPDYGYVNLEDPDLRRAAESDGADFMAKHPAPLIIDEVQRVPELLSRIQVKVDENPTRKAAYILTGSHQPALREGISQSLAGRVAIATLMPLSIGEVAASCTLPTREELVFKGFMPRIYGEGATPGFLYANYLSTYVERDVNAILALKDRRQFETFLRLVAGRVGQLVNYESIASEVGVSAATIKAWLSVLEASYITFTLPCYYRNFGKRFVKAPKVYFSDVGLCCHLLGIREAEQVDRAEREDEPGRRLHRCLLPAAGRVNPIRRSAAGRAANTSAPAATAGRALAKKRTSTGHPGGRAPQMESHSSRIGAVAIAAQAPTPAGGRSCTIGRMKWAPVATSRVKNVQHGVGLPFSASSNAPAARATGIQLRDGRSAV